jgi:hypothetical protein
MAEIRCFIPIRLRLTGELDDDAAAELTDSLAATLGERLALARRHAAEYADIGTPVLHPPDIRISGTLDEEQERRVGDVIRASIALAAGDARGAGHSSRPAFRLVSGGSVRARPTAAARAVPAVRRAALRPWIIRKSVNFHAAVDDFLELVGNLSPALAPARDLYWEWRNEERWVELWLVQINQPYLLNDLSVILRDRAMQLGHLRANQTIAFAAAPGESHRQNLISIDLDGVVTREISDLTTNARLFTISTAGAISMQPGCFVLFAWMIVPLVTLADRADVSAPDRRDVTLASVQELFGLNAFRAHFGIEMSALLAELPMLPATLVIIPFLTKQRTPWVTMQRLMTDYVEGYEQQNGYRAGDLFLLNQSTLDRFPNTIRDAVLPYSDATTRALPESATGGDFWEANWRAAAVYAITAPTEVQVQTALYHPVARQAAAWVLRQMDLDPNELAWPFRMDGALVSAFGGIPRIAFELFLAELEDRGKLLAFFDAIFARRHSTLIYHVMNYARSTRYATHARVVELYRWINERRRQQGDHEYHIAEQEIWLRRNPGRRVRVGDIIADVDSIYSVEETKKELKPERREPFRLAIQEQSRILVGQIERGENAAIYDAEGFMAEVFGRAAAAIHLTNDDFNDLHFERTFRLLGLEQRIEESIEYVYVTYDIAERVNGGLWTIVQNSRTTLRDDLGQGVLGEKGFELTLWFWGFNKAAVVVQAFAIGVSIIAVVAVAWEVGIVAALVEAAGGTTVVLTSIAFSELIYLARVIFGDAHFSFEGLLMAAVEGYLFALGFRGAGLIGRGLARGIGTTTLRRLLLGWAVERLAVGTIGGAASAFLITFTQDTINIILGRQSGYRSIEAYVTGMAWGALLGTVFEFGIGALQPVLHVGGATGLQTIEEVVQRVRTAGLSAEAWGTMMSEALGKMHTNLAAYLDETLAGRITTAMRARILETLRWYGGEARVGLFRRVLELSPDALSRGSAQGLERLLTISPRFLADQAVLDVLNSVSGSGLRRFLETFNATEAQIAEQVVRGSGLRAVAQTPGVLPFIERDVVISRFVRELSNLPQPAAAARLNRLLDLVRTRPVIPETVTRGAQVARGGTNIIYAILEDPNLLLKPAGGRLATEAVALVELEVLGIPTVYGSAIDLGGSTTLVMPRIQGVGSKDIIGRANVPLEPPQHTEVVTQRTIDDLHRIRAILEQNDVGVRDFQFIVREADGAVLMNDPTGLSWGGTRARSSRRMREIINDFEQIWRDRQAAASRGTTGGTP